MGGLGVRNPPPHEPVIVNLYSIIYVYFLTEWALINNNNDMKQVNINRTIEVNTEKEKC
jgi:hypothetical protein